MVERELGAPISELFSEFSEAPIAAASLAQVRTLPSDFHTNFHIHACFTSLVDIVSRRACHTTLHVCFPSLPLLICAIGIPETTMPTSFFAAADKPAGVSGAGGGNRAGGGSQSAAASGPGHHFQGAAGPCSVWVFLYVLRRAVGVYERLVRRFTAQSTDYQRLLSTFAEGLYTEMDFRNEALNAGRMAELLAGR